MALSDFSSRDWLVLCGLATLLLAWWVSFGMLRERRPATELGAPELR